jgi:hypothetical protein
VRQANGDVAINLNATNFKAFINASPKSFTVVKFFAHWSELRQELDSSPPVLSLSRDIDEEAAADLDWSKIQRLGDIQERWS